MEPGEGQRRARGVPEFRRARNVPTTSLRCPCHVPTVHPHRVFSALWPPPPCTHSLNQRRSKGVWAVTGTRMNTNYTWILSGGFVGQHRWGIRGCGRSKKVLPKYTRHYNHWISSMRTRHFRMTRTASKRIRCTPASAGSPTGGVPSPNATGHRWGEWPEVFVRAKTPTCNACYLHQKLSQLSTSTALPRTPRATSHRHGAQARGTSNWSQAQGTSNHSQAPRDD